MRVTDYGEIRSSIKDLIFCFSSWHSQFGIWFWSCLEQKSRKQGKRCKALIPSMQKKKKNYKKKRGNIFAGALALAVRKLGFFFGKTCSWWSLDRTSPSALSQVHVHTSFHTATEEHNTYCACKNTVIHNVYENFDLKKRFMYCGAEPEKWLAADWPNQVPPPNNWQESGNLWFCIFI